MAVTQAAAPYVTDPTWSGYLAHTGGIVTEADGDWTVPTLNCTDTPNAGTSQWVGTGGWFGEEYGLLLQTGEISQCVDGGQRNYGWWQLYPTSGSGSTEFAPTTFPVSAGDQMAAYVYRITSNCSTYCGHWETVLEDLTTGLEGVMITGDGEGVASIGSSTFTEQGSTATLSYSGGTSAEWIVEDFGTPSVPFANFGTVRFSDLHMDTTAPILTGDAVAIEQNGVVLSAPTTPTGDGFSVNYTGP